MELARKPAKQENQQQQAKWIGSRGVAVKIKVEEEGTQFVGKEERHERRADEFGENGGMAIRGQRIDPQKVKNAPHIFRYT